MHHILELNHQNQGHRTRSAYRGNDGVHCPKIPLSTDTYPGNRLFSSGEDSDFTVKCGNQTWQLHRIILRSGSEYFKHACSGKFQVCLECPQHLEVAWSDTDSWQEGASCIIELKEEDPWDAGILLWYFYAHDYQIDIGGIPASVAHARVYAIADKYGVGLLKDLAKARFALAVRNTVATDIPSLIAATELVYASTPSSDRGLRNCVKPKLIEFKQQLRDSDDFMALFVSGLDGGHFAVEMLDAWAGLNPKRRDYL